VNSTTKIAKRYRRKDASAYLLEKHGISRTKATLAKLAVIGGGPVMVYDGSIPLYPEDGLDAYAAAAISPPVRSSSERQQKKNAA
jgi:hypothetical protein